MTGKLILPNRNRERVGEILMKYMKNEILMKLKYCSLTNKVCSPKFYKNVLVAVNLISFVVSFVVNSPF